MGFRNWRWNILRAALSSNTGCPTPSSVHSTVGEGRALGDHEVMSGNIKLAMSHVLPDLAQNALKGQNPLHILGDGRQVRCYTHGSDLGRGIAICVDHP